VASFHQRATYLLASHALRSADRNVPDLDFEDAALDLQENHSTYVGFPS